MMGALRRLARKNPWLIAGWAFFYKAFYLLFWPLNHGLARVTANRYTPGSVLHISLLTPIAAQTVAILREHGVRADYMGLGDNPHFSEADYKPRLTGFPPLRVLQEIYLVWRIVAKYEIIHCHFMHTLTYSGWEIPVLRRLGRKIVAHYRGCEVRDPDRIMARAPRFNLCQSCDYDRGCLSEAARQRRELGQKYADLLLVTTPDMVEFVPGAVQLPFFGPPESEITETAHHQAGSAFKIVHATNHPGLDGTDEIVRVVDRLRSEGRKIRLKVLTGVGRDRVLAELAAADLSIGKMKMGFYANSQIEAMALGVPTITWVRDEFITPELAASGFILTDLEHLEKVLRYYLEHPRELEEKRAKARSSIRTLHDNSAIAGRLIDYYRELSPAVGSGDKEAA